LSKDINNKRNGLEGNDKNSILIEVLMEELELCVKTQRFATCSVSKLFPHTVSLSRMRGPGRPLPSTYCVWFLQSKSREYFPLSIRSGK
jgi:hypothetical protein